MSELRKIFESIMNKDRNNAQNSIIDDNQKIIIYKGELDYLSKCILESPQVETGGNLFGLWTPFGIPFIQYVVGPGKNAEHHNTHFRQDFSTFICNLFYIQLYFYRYRHLFQIHNH